MSNKQDKNEFLDVKDPKPSMESLRITKEAQKPKIVRVQQSALLERARLFLPKIAEANSKLASQPRDKINIENIDSNQPGIIKMDLGLGVFDCIDPESSNNDNLVIPNKEDLLKTQQNLDLNIMLNPSDLPDDYTKPLIQMLADSDDSSDSDSDSESNDDSESESEDDSDDSDDVDMEDANDEDVAMEN